MVTMVFMVSFILCDLPSELWRGFYGFLYNSNKQITFQKSDKNIPCAIGLLP